MEGLIVALWRQKVEVYMNNSKDRTFAASRAAEFGRTLDRDEVEAVAGGSTHWVPKNPNSGNIASDDGYYEYD